VRPSRSDLPGVLRRCRLGDESAWGEFHAWVDIIARWSLAAFNGLGRADRQDIVATAIERLIPVVRGDRIRGTTGLEIKAYVARAIRNIAVHPGSPWVTPRRGEGASTCSGAGQPHGTRGGRRGPGRFWSGHPSQGRGGRPPEATQPMTGTPGV
jgi:hypothetical protein